uniref:Polymerase nucleotidyl transferase domain-containing protein n=1 Tax=Thermosporothrix sp. COM3 TaxID=2490863 RepID=A0A455SJ13_9CHLR|nr:hypothetical protein KTC_16900 [Thermosporothrix sp. COM3]
MDAALVDEIRCWLDAHVEHIQAIIVRGSFARGEQTPYSDVDIGCYVPEPYEPVKHFLQLQGRLVAISVKTLAHERAAIQQPERAVFAVPDLRGALILYASTGAFQDFQRFEWTPLRPAADQHASWMLMRLSEHARKVLSGLSKNDPLSSVSVVAVLSVALCDVLGVQRGLLAQCGITYSAQVQTSVGVHSRWTFWYRLLVGVEPMTSGVSIARMRSLAACISMRKRCDCCGRSFDQSIALL